ncbi:RNA polymerase sigma-70 factor [Leptolyngbya sp. NIES-2104]|uniref:RNA polymerase sigma-70 factor n=1 Tax=Leptolyngbya sp. NIES-2104 TaxID=1552121 RepID=UPI0006ECC85E|nr:RNA polymerase sigma-70 factor [Leptolyngbya sp. NIES-2104]GAP99768.1 RNA polymerase sigma-70 factor [Leptolyngbya sp. NIES-2104]
MNRLEVFNQYRSLLFAIAYRMLGTVTDAEDILQEAWIRWQKTDSTVQSPKAFLSSMVTRLCIDQLRSARVQRERYIGTWLPEPLLTDSSENFQDNAELAETLSFAFLMLLECLSPTERAVFLLREVFDYDYEDIAQVVGKSVSNCRQIVHRSRQHLVLRRPTMQISARSQEALIEQFLTYWNQGDLEGLVTLMSEDIAFWSDGGGKAIAAQKPLYGDLKIARFLIAIRASNLAPVLLPELIKTNGQLGILNRLTNGEAHSIFSFNIIGEKIQSIFAVVNPEKLRAVRRDAR